MDWNLILNWRLLKGSHDFPGPDGGTCVTEAAIVAAGFKYNQVESIEDCPPCFSRVIAAYALRLNDSIPDDLRQELLMPFVARLAGTADTREIEIKRAIHIAVQTVKRILPISLGTVGLTKEAHRCRAVEDTAAADAAERVAEAVIVAERAVDAARYAAIAAIAAERVAEAAIAADAARYAAIAAERAADAAYAARYAASAVDAARYAAIAADAAERVASAPIAASAARYAAIAAEHAADAARYAAERAADAARYAASAAEAAITRREIFTIAVAILDEAIRLGKQADPVEVTVVQQRMDGAKRRELCAI